MTTSTLTVKQLHSRLRGGRLFLAKVDDHLWATNAYWAVRVPKVGGPIRGLLHEFNLPARHSVTCEVGSTVRRFKPKRPFEFASVVDKLKKGQRLNQVTYGGHRVEIIDQPGGGRLSIWQHPRADVPTVVNVELQETVEALVTEFAEGPVGWHGTGNPLLPICWRESAGPPLGLLMPVRATWDFDADNPALDIDQPDLPGVAA